MDTDKEMIKTAICSIESGFKWEHTTQGSDYWRMVVSNLEKMLKEKKAKG